jgi:hypothetical protein
LFDFLNFTKLDYEKGSQKNRWRIGDGEELFVATKYNCDTLEQAISQGDMVIYPEHCRRSIDE